MERKIANSIISPAEKCPACGADIQVKAESSADEYHRLSLYNLDGSPHRCGTAERSYKKHPIGQKVTGKKVIDYQLRGRRLTITLDDGNILSVVAAGTPLTISLEGSQGIWQE